MTYNIYGGLSGSLGSATTTATKKVPTVASISQFEKTTVPYASVPKVTQTAPTAAPAVYPTYTPNLGGMQAQFDELMRSYDQQRSALEAQYGTNADAASTAYQNLLDSLAKQEQASKEQFGASRATIAEDAFTRGRQLASALASRMLSGSGLMQLGDVQNRMETGRQVSQAAGQYGETQEQIAQSKVEATQNYETAKQQLSNTLAGQLASLLSGQASAGLSYQQSVEGLRQAAASSAAQGYQFSEQQKLAQEGLLSTLPYDISAYTTQDPTVAGSLSYTQRLAAVKSILNQAGQTTDPTTYLKTDALAQYNAALAANDKGKAAKIKTAFIAAGYPASWFPTEIKKTATSTTVNPTIGNGMPGNWY